MTLLLKLSFYEILKFSFTTYVKKTHGSLKIKNEKKGGIQEERYIPIVSKLLYCFIYF